MSIKTNLDRLETKVKAQALATIQAAYDLTAEEITLAAEAKRLLAAEHPSAALSELLSVFMQDLTDPTVRDHWQARVDWAKAAYRSIGIAIDLDRIHELVYEVQSQYHPATLQTIDDLLKIDREIYERAKQEGMNHE